MKSGTYDFEANKALLKLYQFFPDLCQPEKVALMLAKVTNLVCYLYNRRPHIFWRRTQQLAIPSSNSTAIHKRRSTFVLLRGVSQVLGRQ